MIRFSLPVMGSGGSTRPYSMMNAVTARGAPLTGSNHGRGGVSEFSNTPQCKRARVLPMWPPLVEVICIRSYASEAPQGMGAGVRANYGNYYRQHIVCDNIPVLTPPAASATLRFLYVAPVLALLDRRIALLRDSLSGNHYHGIDSRPPRQSADHL